VLLVRLYGVRKEDIMKTIPRIPTFVRPLVIALAFAGVPSVAVASASASASTATSCATTTAHWGSLTKSLNRLSPAPITNVRAGRNTCFDRMVVDIRGKGAGYTARYVSQVVSQGRGAVVPLRGGAKLEVVIKAPTYDINTGASTYNPGNSRELVNVTGFSTFRQIASGGSSEGYSTIGLGVRARLPMRVFILDGPGTGSRVVIDVAHHW
jgi:hypothetical protein